MLTFEEWCDEQEYIHFLVGDFYECPGGHVWHEDDVVKLYEDYVVSHGNGENTASF